jgi:alpha-tubulin suppressor-like RCC1 family protein
MKISLLPVLSRKSLSKACLIGLLMTLHLAPFVSAQNVIGWGDNSRGQLNVPASATNAIAVAAGQSQSLALLTDGSVLGWGNDVFGSAKVPASATNVVAIAAGYNHSLALRADGSVLAWGNNMFGQCNVPPSATNVLAIAAGFYHSVALKSDGTMLAWGTEQQRAVQRSHEPEQRDCRGRGTVQNAGPAAKRISGLLRREYERFSDGAGNCLACRQTTTGCCVKRRRKRCSAGRN